MLEHLAGRPGTSVWSIEGGVMLELEDFTTESLPEPTEPLHLCLCRGDGEDLVWHASPPEISGPTHGNLVQNLLALREWEERGLAPPNRLLNYDLSPVITYQRGSQHNGRASQNVVLAPPSSLRRVDPGYERRVKQSLSWIRRRGTIVHDYRNQTDKLPNPHLILNTIYAFPDVLEEIRSGEHRFAIA